MEVREPSAKYLAKLAYKQTEVGVIPEDWQIVPLSSLAQIHTGIAKNTNATLLDPIEIPYLRVANVQDGYLDLGEVSTITIERNDLKRFSVLPNDVLMNEGGDLDKLGRGSVWLGQIQPCVHQNHVFVVRCKAGLLPAFLNAWTSSPAARRYFLLAGRQTTNLASINKTSLGLLPVPVPTSVTEQQAIAEALSDADALIESLDQLLAKKRQIKQGAMQELLTGQKRLPGFSGEWSNKPLRAIAAIQRGASPRPIESPIWFDENSTVGWVRISDVTQSGMYLTETDQRLSARGIQQSRPVAAGSLIMSICATVGRPIITKIDTCIHDGFVVFDKPIVNLEYLYYALSHMEDGWSRHGQTGSQMNLNTGLINSTEITLPPTVDEQTAIATVLSDLDAEIAALEARLAKARLLKQGMMQELLTGRIRLI